MTVGILLLLLLLSLLKQIGVCTKLKFLMLHIKYHKYIFFHLISIYFLQNEAQYDQVFSEANFKTYIFKLRAKVETYNVSICIV